MQTIELMTGDWVFYPKTQEYCKVTTIHHKYLYCFPKGSDEKHSYGLKEESVCPIPLTKEILKKNGFEFCKSFGGWTNEDADFILTEYADNFRVRNTPIILKYVHQLQNMFKLYRIDKDIEL